MEVLKRVKYSQISLEIETRNLEIDNWQTEFVRTVSLLYIQIYKITQELSNVSYLGNCPQKSVGGFFQNPTQFEERETKKIKMKI